MVTKQYGERYLRATTPTTSGRAQRWGIRGQEGAKHPCRSRLGDRCWQRHRTPKNNINTARKMQVRLRTAIKHKTKEPMRRQAMDRDALETMATTHGSHCLERAQYGCHMSKKPRSSQGAQRSPGQPGPLWGDTRRPQWRIAGGGGGGGAPSQTRLHSMVGRLLLSQIQCVCVCASRPTSAEEPPPQTGVTF